MLSDEEKAGLMDAAVQMIDSSLNSNDLFDETCSLSKKLRLALADQTGSGTGNQTSRFAKANGSSAMEKFLKVTCPNRLSLAEKEDNLLFKLKTPILAQQIIEISQETTAHQEPLLNESQRERLLTVTKMLKLSMEKSYFVRNMFTAMLLRYSLHLEVLWSLHKVLAVDLATFLTSKLKRDEYYMIKLPNALVALCMGPSSTLHLRQEILSGFIVFLIKYAFCDRKTATGQLAKRVLNSVLEGVIELSCLDMKEESLALPSNFLAAANIIEPNCVHKFAVHSLSLILSHHTCKTIQCLMKSEVKWSLCETSVLLPMIKEFFLPLKCSEVCDILMRALENQPINSSHIFTCLTAFYTCYPEASTTIKGKLQTLISSALENSNSMDLYTPFFVARLSSATGSHLFPSYSDWFQATFCSPSSLVASKSSCTLLIKFLSSLVPWESPERLKAYIFHKSNLPENCKDLYEDFVDLSKTRLMDLGIPLCEVVTSVYGNSSLSGSNNSLENDQVNKVRAVDTAEQDVVRAVASFSESRKIPTILMQASIFQKPYFMGKFLPALLKPRVLPDSPDEKMLLIAELTRSGKIPATAYDQYLQACETEKQALLEGVFDVDDDDDEMVELTLPLMEQLQKSLNKFTAAVLSGTSEVQTGCRKSVIEKVAAVVAEAPGSSEGNSTKVSDKSVVVDLSQPSCLPTDNISEFSRLLIKQMASLETQWRDQSRGEQEKRSFPTALSKPYVKLTQALVQQFPVLRPTLYSTVLTILNQKGGQGIKDVHISNLGLPTMCLCLVNLAYAVTLIKEKGELYETNSFMETVGLCLDIINGSENVLRFCLDYVKVACNWLTTLEEQLAQQDVVELGSTCVTEEDLLPPAFIQKVNFTCQRRGLIEIDGCCSFSLKQEKLARQTYILYKNGQWQQLCKKHQVSLEDWMEMEWYFHVSVDPLSAQERSSYLLKTSGIYLQTLYDLPTFCKTVLLTLARLSDCQSSCDSRNKELKCACFLQLLKSLLENPSEYVGNESSLLLRVLQCSEDCTNQIIRFALDLPSHLLFYDSLQQDFEPKHVATALETIGYFTRSSHNKGAYLSVEATTYIFKGIEILGTAHPWIPATALDSVLMHPIVFTSLLVHSSVTTKVDISNTPWTVFSSWHFKVKAVEMWLQRVTEKESVQLTTDRELPSLEDWQKAAALFTCILSRKPPIDLSKFILQESVQYHLLQMMVANLTVNKSLEEVKMLPKQNGVARSFIEILSNDPAVLRHLLNSETSESNLRGHLGIQDGSKLAHLHDFIILRLAKDIPANIIMQSLSHNVIAPVVAAYWRILTNAQDLGTNWQELDLSCWMKLLVDLSSPNHLDSIPEVGIDETDLSFSLENQDVLLFKYIQEMRRQKKDGNFCKSLKF